MALPDEERYTRYRKRYRKLQKKPQEGSEPVTPPASLSSTSGAQINSEAPCLHINCFALAMSALETAKEIGRIASTANLGKDVIVDLLEKKITLLAEQITTLEQEKSVLNTENANLKKKVIDLQQHLDRLNPKQDGLEEEAAKMLLFLFDRPDTAIECMTEAMGISRGIGDYHRDGLVNASLIRPTGIAISGDWGSTSGPYDLTPKGREYVIKNILKRDSPGETNPLPFVDSPSKQFDLQPCCSKAG